MADELFLVLLLAGLIGGAVGAILAKAAPWKGAIIAAFGTVVPIAISVLLQIDNAAIGFVAGLIAFGVAGGAFKFTGRQIVVVFLGSFLASAAALALLGNGLLL